MRCYEDTQLVGDAIRFKYVIRTAPPLIVFLAVLVCFATVIGAVPGVRAAEPLESKPFPFQPGARLTELTGFSASGRIIGVIRNAARIVVLCDKPHWGAFPRYSRDRIVLWPAKTRLILKIAVVAPMTIDGKKVGFDQLAVGQTISAQYSIIAPGPYCAARRIEGSTTAPAKTSTEGHRPN